jgi:hypothetical protein
MATEEPPYSPMVGPTKVNLRDLSREGEEVSVSSAEGVWQLGLAHRNAPHRDDFHLVLADATAFASDVLQYAQLGTVEEFGFPDSARLRAASLPAETARASA